nr:retrotransposon protein, putative, Ty1-copia subclass [Tanacetum cinerariifolium]
MKLSVDLSTKTSNHDNLYAKNAGIFFLITMLANFLPSLGLMDDKELLLNMVAWGILVITITVNVWIQTSTDLLSSASNLLDISKKILNANEELVEGRKASRRVGIEVEVYQTWLHIDLQNKACKSKTSKDILQWLGDEAEEKMKRFKEKKTENLDHSFQDFIAARSMYRISQTILLYCNDQHNCPTDAEVFEWILTTIGDILYACFTKLPRVITMKCHHDAIEKRQKSIRTAAQILVPFYLLIFPLLLVFAIALTVQASRRNLEHKYKELHKLASYPQDIMFSSEELVQDVKKYWMMAETSNPQFSIACSEVSSALRVICSVIVFIELLFIKDIMSDYEDSDYKWSIRLIIIVQLFGVVVGMFEGCYLCLIYFAIELRVVVEIVQQVVSEPGCCGLEVRGLVLGFEQRKRFGFESVSWSCRAALDPFPGTMTDADKTTALKTYVCKKAHSALLLCLDNKVLREVNKKDSVAGKKLSEHIDKINKLIGDLANIDVDIDDEDQALMLLTSLPPSYDKFVETLLYGRERRLDHQGNQGHDSSRSMSIGKGTYKLKCYICYYEDHLKKDCSKKNKKKSTGFVKKNARQGSGMHSEGYDNGDLLMAVSEERACDIIGIWKVRVQMKDGSSFMLENVRYIPELKRNLISLGTLDREGYTMKLQNGRVKAESGEASVGIQEKESLAQVWHKRLGHISEAGLHELEKKRCLGIKEFNNLCKESGIARHLTVAGTLQQNGLAERMNITLLNKVSCLLIQSSLPYSFWAEATVMTAYLINRSPSTSLEKKTPMDLWSGHSANYEMLRIFGCAAYSYVNQGKLKPKAIKCIFLGYPDGLKGYRLWRVEPTIDPHTGENPGNEDEEQDEEPQQQNLNNYVLVRDRAKRTTTIPARYRDEGNVSLSRPSGSKVDDMAAYAFAIAEEEDTHEPITFQEAINSSEKDEVILSLTACEDYELEQLDVKTTFLHGNLEETIYMRQPPGFEEGTGNKGLLRKEFDIKELGLARKILGLEIVRDRGSRTLKVPQSGYVQKILNNCRVDNGKSAYVPLGAHFKVSLKDCPLNDWDVERMSKVPYVNVVGLVYGKDQGNHVDVDGFVDADYAKDPNKSRSITGEIMESKEIKVAKIGTKDNAADMFIKVVPGPKFKYCMEILGVEIN